MAELAKDLQEKFVLYQLLNQRLEEIKQHATIIQHKLLEFETSKNALIELKDVKADSEMLIPLGSGLFTHGKSGSQEKILVDLGAGIIAKKSLEDASGFIDKKKKEVEDAVQVLQMEANAITAKLNEIVPELQKAAQDQEMEKGAGAG